MHHCAHSFIRVLREQNSMPQPPMMSTSPAPKPIPSPASKPRTSKPSVHKLQTVTSGGGCKVLAVLNADSPLLVNVSQLFSSPVAGRSYLSLTTRMQSYLASSLTPLDTFTCSSPLFPFFRSHDLPCSPHPLRTAPPTLAAHFAQLHCHGRNLCSCWPLVCSDPQVTPLWYGFYGNLQAESHRPPDNMPLTQAVPTT